MRSEEERTSRRALSRREFLRLAGLGGGVAILAACGTTPPATTESPAATEAPAEEPAEAATEAPAEAPTEPPAAAEPTPIQLADGQVKIAWWNGYSTDTVKQVTPPMIAEFEKLYPNVKVEYELTGGPPGGGNFSEVLLSRIAGGNPPDVATLFTTPAEFAARGSLQEIDDFMRDAQWAKPDAFFPAPLQSCQWQGKTYGLPSSAGACAVFYNVEEFNKKGISTKREDFPKTWDELKALAGEFIVRDGDTIKQVGIVPWGQAWFNPIWSGNNGGQLYDVENNRYVLASEQNIEWLTYWLTWLDDQLGGNLEQLNINGPWVGAYPDQGFGLKTSVMTLDGGWATTDAEIPFEWEVAKLPVGPSGSKSVTGFWPNWWALPKGTPHPEEAFHFIEFISTKGWEIWYKGIMDTPAWKEFPADVVTAKLVENLGEDRARNIHGFFAEYLNDAVPMWSSPIESFASDTFAAMLEEVLSKSKTPKQALEEAQSICQARLDEVVQGGA